MPHREAGQHALLGRGAALLNVPLQASSQTGGGGRRAVVTAVALHIDARLRAGLLDGRWKPSARAVRAGTHFVQVAETRDIEAVEERGLLRHAIASCDLIEADWGYSRSLRGSGPHIGKRSCGPGRCPRCRLRPRLARPPRTSRLPPRRHRTLGPGTPGAPSRNLGRWLRARAPEPRHHDEGRYDRERRHACHERVVRGVSASRKAAVRFPGRRAAPP